MCAMVAIYLQVGLLIPPRTAKSFYGGFVTFIQFPPSHNAFSWRNYIMLPPFPRISFYILSVILFLSQSLILFTFSWHEILHAHNKIQLENHHLKNNWCSLHIRACSFVFHILLNLQYSLYKMPYPFLNKTWGKRVQILFVVYFLLNFVCIKKIFLLLNFLDIKFIRSQLSWYCVIQFP